MRPFVTIVAVTMSLAACTDLSAVQKFADTGSAVAASEPVISNWSSARDRLNRLAALPTLRQSAAPIRKEFEMTTADLAAKAPLAEAAAKALANYLLVLGQLSGGKVDGAAHADVSKDIATIQSQLSTLTIGNLLAVRDATNALALLTLAQQNLAVGEVIKGANPHVKTITQFLAATAQDIAFADNQLKLATNELWTAFGGQSNNRNLIVFIQRAMAEDDDYYADRVTRAKAAQRAFQAIGADHDALANANPLSGAFATLSQNATLLQTDLGILLRTK
jgi:hypothetical protein